MTNLVEFLNEQDELNEVVMSPSTRSLYLDLQNLAPKIRQEMRHDGYEREADDIWLGIRDLVSKMSTIYKTGMRMKK